MKTVMQEENLTRWELKEKVKDNIEKQLRGIIKGTGYIVDRPTNPTVEYDFALSNAKGENVNLRVYVASTNKANTAVMTRILKDASLDIVIVYVSGQVYTLTPKEVLELSPNQEVDRIHFNSVFSIKNKDKIDRLNHNIERIKKLI